MMSISLERVGPEIDNHHSSLSSLKSAPACEAKTMRQSYVEAFTAHNEMGASTFNIDYYEGGKDIFQRWQKLQKAEGWGIRDNS